MTLKSIFYVLMATWGQFDCITPAMWPPETGTNISSNHLVNLTPPAPVQEGHNECSSVIKPILKSSLNAKKLHIKQARKSPNEEIFESVRSIIIKVSSRARMLLVVILLFVSEWSTLIGRDCLIG